MSAQTMPRFTGLAKKKAATGGLVTAFHLRDPSPKEKITVHAGGCGLIENERGPHQN
jgi:hypothetical protein